MDCDLQAKFYSQQKKCTIENATYGIVSNPKVQEIIANGAETVWDVFHEADKNIYKNTFLEEFFAALKSL